MATFTSKLNTPPLTSPTWYYSGTRILSINHAKLRMLCSPLNDHLFSHIHVIDSPDCLCGHFRENNKHFLIDCPLYLIERNQMFNKLMQIGFQPSLNNILYGNSQYTEECNIMAFSIIQEHIAATERF